MKYLQVGSGEKAFKTYSTICDDINEDETPKVKHRFLCIKPLHNYLESFLMILQHLYLNLINRYL